MPWRAALFVVSCLALLAFRTSGGGGCSGEPHEAISEISGEGTDVDAHADDGDGIPLEEDNCPSFPNPRQIDTDEDGIGDLCEALVVPEPVSEEPLVGCDPLFVCQEDIDCAAVPKADVYDYACVGGCCEIAADPDCKQCSEDPESPLFGSCGKDPCIEGCCPVIACAPDDPDCIPGGGEPGFCGDGTCSGKEGEDCGTCESDCGPCGGGCEMGGSCPDFFPSCQEAADFLVCQEQAPGADSCTTLGGANCSCDGGSGCCVCVF